MRCRSIDLSKNAMSNRVTRSSIPYTTHAAKQSVIYEARPSRADVIEDTAGTRARSAPPRHFCVCLVPFFNRHAYPSKRISKSQLPNRSPIPPLSARTKLAQSPRRMLQRRHAERATSDLRPAQMPIPTTFAGSVSTSLHRRTQTIRPPTSHQSPRTSATSSRRLGPSPGSRRTISDAPSRPPVPDCTLPRLPPSTRIPTSQSSGIRLPTSPYRLPDRRPHPRTPPNLRRHSTNERHSTNPFRPMHAPMRAFSINLHASRVYTELYTCDTRPT